MTSCSVQDGEIDAEELQRCLTQAGFTGSYSRKFTAFSLTKEVDAWIMHLHNFCFNFEGQFIKVPAKWAL